MAITRYAGDRFTIADGETKPTGVLDGAYLIDTGNLTQFVRRTVAGSSQWSQLAGGGGGGSPGGANTQVQFNNAGSFGGGTGLTFDGHKLYASSFELSGTFYDSDSSVGENGMVLTNRGQTGVHWKSIESVLSGVGGSGVANYVARWSDEDTLTSGTIFDNGDVGIGTDNPQYLLEVYGDATLNSSTATTDATLRWEAAGATKWRIKNDTQVAGGTAHTLAFTSAGAANVSINQAGAVGIGTASPATKLTVHQSADDNGLRIYGYDDVAARYAELFVNSAGYTVLDASTDRGLVLKGHGIDFYINSGGTHIGRWTFDGNLGIGTTNPSELLHAYKTANAAVAISVQNPNTGNDARARVQLVSDGGTATLTTYSAAFATSNQNIADSALLRASSLSGGLGLSADGATPLHFWTNDTERMRILSDGKVGIGTDAPEAKVQIRDTSLNVFTAVGEHASYHMFINGSSTDDTGSALGFGGVADVGAAIVSKRIGTNYKSNLLFYTKDSIISAVAPTLAMTIQSDGNVGIGTTAPSSLLHIYENDSTQGNTQLYIHNDKNDDAAVIKLEGKRTGANDTAQVIFANSGNVIAGIQGRTAGADDGLITFLTSAAGSGDVITEQMRIQSDGNVGIGTNAPGFRFEVRESSATWLSRIYNTGTGNGLLVRVDSGSSDAILSTHNGTTHLFVVKGDGNVGIGTYTPTTLFESNVNSASVGTDSVTARNTGVTTIGHSVGYRYQFNTAVPAASRAILEHTNSGRGRLGFFVSTDGTVGNLTEYLSIKSDGVVDINSAKLKINGASGTDGQVLTTDGAGGIAWETNGSGTVTSVGINGGTGLDVTNSPITTSGNITVSLDLNELGQAGILDGSDCLVVVDGTDTKKETISGINLTIFNNNAGWTNNAGTVTSVTAGVGLTMSAGSSTVNPTLATKLDELTNMTAAVVGGTDQLILLDNGDDRRKTINTINLGQFNNDQSWTSNAGTVTSVTAGTGMTQTGTSTVNPTLNVVGGTGLTAAADAINLDDTDVTAGAYTYASITVDAQGRLTAASSGAAPGGGTVTGTGTANYVSKWTGTNSQGNSSIFDNNSQVTIDVPVGVVAGSGSGTLTGRLQIGSTTSTANNSLVFWRGAKPTLAANQGAILYENGGMSDGEGMTFMSDKGYKFLDDAGTTEWVRIKSDGNVGIGVVAPWTRFTIAGGTTAEADDFIQMSVTPSVAGGNSAGVLFGVHPTAGYAKQGIFWERYVGNGGYGGRGKLHFVNRDATDTSVPTVADSKMTILEDGNVGIGTTSPGATLTLSDGTDNFDFDVTENALTIKTTTADAADDQAIVIDAGNGGLSSTRGAYIHLHGNEHSLSAGKAIYQCGNVSTSAHLFRKGGGTDAAIITSDGNVGVGTTAPKSLLEASGVIRSTHATSVSAGVGIEMLYNNTDGTGYLYSYDRDGSAYKTTRIGSESYFIADGNVGIATATPEHQFQVYGDALISGKFYDSTNSTGDKGYVLTSDDTGPLWAASGDFDGLSGNLITTGQTLTSLIASTGTTNAAGIVTNASAIADNTSNLITTGQTLQTQITANDGDISTLTSNLITTGQTLQTQITSNDTDIATNTTNIATNVTNLVATGQFLTNALPVGADPTAVISGAATNGSATTFMRSDAAPALKDTEVTAGSYTYAAITVNAQGRLTAASNGTAPGGGTVTGTGTANYISKWTGTNSQGSSQIFDDGTSVGIGTDSPTGKVQIDGLTAARFLTLNAPTDGGYITFETANTAFADIGTAKGISGIATYSTTDLMINARSGAKNIVFGMNGYEKVRIDNNGKVGIGTTAPYYDLDVRFTNNDTGFSSGDSGNWGGNGLRLQNLSTTVGSMALIQFRTSTAEWFIGNKFVSTNDSDFIFNHENSEKVRFTSDGNVGIGTNDPTGTFKLDIVGQTKTTLVTSRTTVAGVNGTVADENSYELGPGYLNLNRDDTVATRQIQFGKNGSLHSALMTNSVGLHFLGSDGGVDVTINSNGNLGIGTTSPSAPLDVVTSSNVWAAEINQTNASNGDGLFVDTGSTASADYVVSFRAGGANIFDVKANGRVGIGAPTPGEKLEVNGGNAKITSSSNVYLSLDTTQANGDEWHIFNAVSGTTSGLQFKDIDTSKLVMLLQEDGNVGIGNAAPAYKLEVTGSVTGDWLSRIHNTATTNTPSGLLVKVDMSTAGGYILGCLADSNYRFVVQNDGKVGVGTVTPAAKLEIYTGNIRLSNDYYLEWGGTKARIGGSNTGDYVFFLTDNTDRMRIKSDGNVGIGTNNPSRLLHVNGGSDYNARFTSASTRSGIVIDKPGTTTIMGSALVLADETYKLGTASYYHVVMYQGGATYLLHQGNTKIQTTATGVTVTGTLTETSSITLKENVETYTPSLDIINKIRPVKYNRKTNKDKKEIGLIAEELAELFPELVEKDEKGNPSSVNYSRAVTVLLGGFKELYKEVKELKEKI